MGDFTSIFNRGIRSYIDKKVKKRKFGKCDACEKPSLLIEYIEPDDKNAIWKLCDSCYEEFLIAEEDDIK